MKVAGFTASFEQDEDGRWSAWLDDLPGCSAWGYSHEEAVRALQDAADAYIEDVNDESRE